MTLVEWVAEMKAKEANQCAPVEDYFGVWAIMWCVERVQQPERYWLKAKLIDPAGETSPKDWETLGRITEAFGAPDLPTRRRRRGRAVNLFPSDPTTPIHWKWEKKQ